MERNAFFSFIKIATWRLNEGEAKTTQEKTISYLPVVQRKKCWGIEWMGERWNTIFMLFSEKNL